MARPSSRINRQKILEELRLAARKGDHASLALALDHMRTLALSPRYWERYLALLGNPLARLVDLLVIKQGERIARQKGWKLAGATTGRARPGRSPKKRPGPRRPRAPASSQEQPLLFDL